MGVSFDPVVGTYLGALRAFRTFVDAPARLQASSAELARVARRLQPGAAAEARKASVDVLTRLREAEVLARCYATLKEARVFSFPGIQPGDLEAHVTRALGIPGIPDPFDLLPFPAVWFGFGAGLRFFAKDDDPEVVLGIVARRTGDAWIVVDGTVGGGDRPYVAIDACVDRDWEPDLVGLGWFLYGLVTAMQEGPLPPATRLAPSLGLRREMDRQRRAGCPPVPPAYYTIGVDSAHVHRIVEAVTHSPPAWSHQWDVERHVRLYVERGSLPIDPALAWALGQRGYTLHVGPLPDTEAARLARRGHPAQGGDEWIALRETPVKSHRKGPADKPYIPGLRRSRATPEPLVEALTP